MFTRKREMKLRKSLLRGIYEENLRIVRKSSPLPSKSKAIPYKRHIVISFLAVLFIFGLWDYLTVPTLKKKEVTATLHLRESAGLTMESSVSPADYRVLLNSRNIPLSSIFGLDVKTIMIDPGHGGVDSGTKGKMGTQEKDIALDIAKRLKRRLERYGRFDVLMTREEDATVPLNMRVELARLSRADLFISIHLNYLPSKPINIIETYYFGPSSDSNVLQLAKQENAGSQYGLYEFKKIIAKIGETLKLQESRELAASIQRSLFVNTRQHNQDIYNFGIKRAPFVVLLGVDVPAVLAEVSCLSNREEERKLNTESHRENIARYLETGILDYLRKGEKGYETERLAERR